MNIRDFMMPIINKSLIDLYLIFISSFNLFQNKAIKKGSDCYYSNAITSLLTLKMTSGNAK